MSSATAPRRTAREVKKPATDTTEIPVVRVTSSAQATLAQAQRPRSAALVGDTASRRIVGTAGSPVVHAVAWAQVPGSREAGAPDARTSPPSNVQSSQRQRRRDADDSPLSRESRGNSSARELALRLEMSEAKWAKELEVSEAKWARELELSKANWARELELSKANWETERGLLREALEASRQREQASWQREQAAQEASRQREDALLRKLIERSSAQTPPLHSRSSQRLSRAGTGL